MKCPFFWSKTLLIINVIGSYASAIGSCVCSGAEIAAIKEELTDNKSRQETYDERLTAIESSLESVIAGLEEKYRQLAKRASSAKDQQKKDIDSLRKELDLFIEIVELSAEAQLDKVRAQRVAKLLKTVRARRTRLENMSAKLANDAA